MSPATMPADTCRVRSKLKYSNATAPESHNSKLVHPNKKAAGVQARAGRRPPRNEAGIASTRADSPHQPRESSLGTLIASGDPK